MLHRWIGRLRHMLRQIGVRFAPRDPTAPSGNSPTHALSHVQTLIQQSP